MLIGLLSGAAAAIVASLISLPLRSPDDAFFNTASVAIGALIAGVAGGALRSPLPPRSFATAWAGAFIATSVVMLLGPFDGMLAFGVPLAAVVFAITGLGVTVLAPRMPASPVVVGGAAVVALGLGLGLAGQGDAESGSLSLPASPAVGTTAAQAAATAASTSTAAAATASATPAAPTPSPKGPTACPPASPRRQT